MNLCIPSFAYADHPASVHCQGDLFPAQLTQSRAGWKLAYGKACAPCGESSCERTTASSWNKRVVNWTLIENAPVRSWLNIKEPSSSTSEYFAEVGESGLNNILATTVNEQAVLRNIIKKTKAVKDPESEFGSDLRVCPRPRRADADEGNKSTNPLSELACRSGEQAKLCIKTLHNSLEFPDPEVENDVNRRQPCRSSSQQKSQSAEWLEAQDLTKALSWICESALPEDKQTLRTSIMQHKRRRRSSEGESEVPSKKADLRDDTVFSQDDAGPEAMENMPLALRILNYKKPLIATGSPEAQMEEQCKPSRKPENVPSNKLKRQRIKK